MINVIPAAPGTFIIEYGHDGIHSYTPIVGWQHVQGNMVFPLTVINQGGLSHGKAVVHPTGAVSDPTHRLCFSDVTEWLSFIAHAKPAKGEPEASTEGSAGTSEPPKANAAPRAAVPEKEKVPVQFGSKTYKTKSFWAYHDSTTATDGIFEIEGEAPYPNDSRCSKITRDEFMALKKDTAVVEPVPFVAEEPDDDDGMDLV